MINLGDFTPIDKKDIAIIVLSILLMVTWIYLWCTKIGRVGEEGPEIEIVQNRTRTAFV